METIALFPLHTVLFPGGHLPLRIFETRYVDLVSECLQQDKGFGVNLIERGSETGDPAGIFPVGTYARIVAWDKQPDGLLGITIEGRQRYRVVHAQARANRLLEGEIAWLSEAASPPLAELNGELAGWLEKLMDMASLPFPDDVEPGPDLAWIAYRLLELLPLPGVTKQTFLQIDDPLHRLEQLHRLLTDLESRRPRQN